MVLKSKILVAVVAAAVFGGCASSAAPKNGENASAINAAQSECGCKAKIAGVNFKNGECGAAQGCEAASALKEAPIGGAKDAHGCLVSAGQSFSKIKNECVQVFDVADLRLDDPDNDTLAVYGVFSADKSKLEIFWASLESSEILSKTKGGYVSANGKISLVKSGKSYKISKR